MKPSMLIAVTLDTNIYPLSEKMLDVIKSGKYMCVHVSVTARELANSDIKPETPKILEDAVWDESCWDEAVWASDPLLETLVLGETPLGSGVLAGDADPFEVILKILSDGSFPGRGKRDSLSTGQQRQLRDALILAAHVRESRQIFVSNDARAFVNHGKRDKLEKLFKTRIFKESEFIEFAASER